MSTTDINDMQKSALEVAAKYRAQGKAKGQGGWGTREYTEGLVGDVGDLMKLMMAKDELRDGDNVDAKLRHELSDCLWSILVIADGLKIDLPKAFEDTMKELHARLEFTS